MKIVLRESELAHSAITIIDSESVAVSILIYQLFALSTGKHYIPVMAAFQ